MGRTRRLDRACPLVVLIHMVGHGRKGRREFWRFRPNRDSAGKIERRAFGASRTITAWCSAVNFFSLRVVESLLDWS